MYKKKLHIHSQQIQQLPKNIKNITKYLTHFCLIFVICKQLIQVITKKS